MKIAIIGGGFSGVMTGVNLVRLSHQPIQLTIINQLRPMARGMAYGTRRPEHLLNVAARNMAAFPEKPDHFLQWLRTRSEFEQVPESELRERFISRLVYGDYLRSLSQHHLQFPAESSLVETTFIEGEAVDLIPETQGASIQLADQRTIKADRIVLATGNEPPAGLPGADELVGHPAWVGNPWQGWESQIPPSGGSVVILGTGLTTVDTVITLRSLGWQGAIHAVSRNGWLPHSHFRGIDYPDFPPAGIDLAELDLKKLVELVEFHCARLRDMGANPALIVDKIRPFTQRIWQNFSQADRVEFVRNYAARWSVLRHRIAPEIHAQLTTSQLIGQLQIHSAGIERVRADGNRVEVQLANGKTLQGDLVINATGPHTKFKDTQSPLLQNLLKRGLVTPDEMEMGPRVDADHTIVNGEGNRSEFLLALGPLLRGTLWESIAVPELRTQARRVAEVLLDQSSKSVETSEPIIEYMI